MKTIKNLKTNEIKRVTDEVANKTVNVSAVQLHDFDINKATKNDWAYCPKSDWKANRPQKKEKVKKEKK